MTYGGTGMIQRSRLFNKTAGMLIHLWSLLQDEGAREAIQETLDELRRLEVAINERGMQ